MGELRYVVVFEPGAASEGGGFTVTVPALPEIVTQGDDLEDALFMARDAIELSLAVRRDEGDEIPPSNAEYARLEIVAVSVPAAWYPCRSYPAKRAPTRACFAPH
jgi:antitoxin HicB